MGKMYIIRGYADYNGINRKRFEVIAPIEKMWGNEFKVQAVKNLHPDWEAISVESWEEL